MSNSRLPTPSSSSLRKQSSDADLTFRSTGTSAKSRLPAPTLRARKSATSLATPRAGTPTNHSPPLFNLPTRVPVTPLRTQTPTSARARVISKPSSPTKPRVTKAPPTPFKSRDSIEEPPARALSVKEAIALRRAEAKKAQAVSRDHGGHAIGAEGANDEPFPAPREEEDVLGRLNIRQTIEKARTTGNLNISSRQLSAIPDLLFSVHLGITPKPLSSQPTETAPTRDDQATSTIAWYEAQDLSVLKARDNDIISLQEEIGLFGSLKTVDLHRNKLTGLPAEFADLRSLTHLDLSCNALESFPLPILRLKSLLSLNISQNSLTELSFTLPGQLHSLQALPSLQALLASGNKLNCVDCTNLPKSLIKIDLSDNPLGNDHGSARNLFSALASLSQLREIHMRSCGFTDEVLSNFSPFASSKLPRLVALDLGDNEGLNESVVRSAFFLNRQTENIVMVSNLSSVVEKSGTVHVVVGKHVLKEAWELDLERRNPVRGKGVSVGEVEESMFGLGFGTKPEPRRERINPPPTSAKPKVVEKEAWEVEIEAGLHTAAGKLRAQSLITTTDASTTDEPVPSTSTLLDKYYNASHATLTLPASLPPSRQAIHARSFSLSSSLPSLAGDPVVPSQTLPLSLIQNQPWSSTLRVLTLSNRRADVCFLLGTGGLARLEELALDGCNLPDAVRTKTVDAEQPTSSSSPNMGGGERTEALIPTLRGLFPNLTVLDLSYNRITTLQGIDALFFPLDLSGGGRGLKALRVRGNKIVDEGLKPLVEIGERFLRAGEGKVGTEAWRGEEIDLRENEIAKLPPLLGLLPLDILLVEGNIFRVPGKRVWERDGTKGLLNWLKDTI